MRIKHLLLSVTAGAAAGTAAYFLKKKLSSSGEKASQPASSAGQAPVQSAASPRSPREAVYSFISGFKDAATVELHFTYDADTCCYSVVEDDFLVESGDSHVGILYGELFSAQFEYGSYYSGEDFAKLREELSAKHADLADVSYGALSGIRFRDGDNFCLAFPVPEDSYSYLLITLVKAPDNDDDLEALPDYPELRALLASVQFSRV